MKIHLIAAGLRPPQWVAGGYQEYARRLSGPVQLALHEIPLGTRGRVESGARARAIEGKRMLAAVPQSARVLALDEQGKRWSTAELARHMKDWLDAGGDTALLIGGPDGLAPECLERAAVHWSLGPLTLPHMLVRVIVAEQVYRAWSLLNKHPYHRG